MINGEYMCKVVICCKIITSSRKTPQRSGEGSETVVARG